VLVSAAAALLLPSLISAQPSGNTGGRSEVFAGSELENYIRFLQTTGAAPTYPWSIRAFSPGEIDSLALPAAGHPWAGRYDLARADRRERGFDLVRPVVSVRYNSGFPYGANDGPIWAGRGITAAARAGVAARWGPVSLTLAPVAFWAQNAAFPLQPNGYTNDLKYADGRFPSMVDLPQRFGDRPYTVLDPGQSTLRVDGRGITVGLSTANQAWGPAAEYPFILGANAAGYPHVFLGSQKPINIWVARVHGRVVYGELSQSDYTDITGTARRRFMSGFIATVEPRGVRGLELGVARFFHTPWPAEVLTWEQIGKPFQGVTKSSVPAGPDSLAQSGGVDNQLAALFLRWVVPGRGFEVYGEYGRDDHNYDMRDFFNEPDQAASASFGLRKAWRRSAERLFALRAEMINFERPQNTRRRFGGDVYIHGSARQGHTERGQLLGAPVGVSGASGVTVGVDRYTTRGRWTASWVRTMRQDNARYLREGVQDPRGMDVQHALGFEVLRFLGEMDVTAGMTAVTDLNRNFGPDAFNASAYVAVRRNVRR
jgi:hypothetical protein